MTTEQRRAQFGRWLVEKKGYDAFQVSEAVQMLDSEVLPKLLNWTISKSEEGFLRFSSVFEMEDRTHLLRLQWCCHPNHDPVVQLYREYCFECIWDDEPMERLEKFLSEL